MRFRAGVLAKNLGLLAGVVSCFEKIGPSCLIYLTPEHIKFASPKLGGDEIRVFCELHQEKIFTEYRIESLSNNTILFEIGLSNLVKALNSARTAGFLKIKLAKRGDQPCICIEARALDIDLLHEIPVRVMRATDMQYYTPPDVAAPKVQLELPFNRSMRVVLDRFKFMDRFCIVDGDMAGSLALRVENDRVKVNTFYGNLIPRFDSMDEVESRQNRSSMKLDVRKLSSALHFMSYKYDSAIYCMIEDSCVLIYVQLMPRGSGTISYFVPTLVLD